MRVGVSLGWRLVGSRSSSELLNGLRVPARNGEGGFLVESTNTDLGRYFGRAEEVEEEVLGRK